MIRLKYIFGWVLLGLLIPQTFPARAQDSLRNLNAYWIHRIQTHEKVLAAENNLVPDQMLYDAASQSLFILNPANRSIDVLKNAGGQDSLSTFAKLDQFSGSPKAMAFGEGILAVIISQPHTPDTLVCLGKDGALLNTWGMDSLMQGVTFNIHREEFMAWSVQPLGYTLMTLNIKEGAEKLKEATMVQHRFYTQPVAVETPAQKMVRVDPYGIMMMILAMTVVFIALILLYLTFKYVARIYTMDLRKRFLKRKGQTPEEARLPDIHDTTGDLGAAIGLALYFYKNQLHDNENTILTIQKAAKAYSPWSSKIYGIRKPLK